MRVAPKMFPQRGDKIFGGSVLDPLPTKLRKSGRIVSAIVLGLGRDMLRNVHGIVALTVFGQGRKKLATI